MRRRRIWDMREQLAARQRDAAAAVAATAQLLATGRATLERSREVLAWFSRAEKSGWINGQGR